MYCIYHNYKQQAADAGNCTVSDEQCSICPLMTELIVTFTAVCAGIIQFKVINLQPDTLLLRRYQRIY